jgi:hypothetical protein
MDTTPLRAAYRTLLEAAATVTGAGVPTDPPPGEWTADQIMAHVAVVTDTTIAAASQVAAGENTTYDNRISQDPWTLDRVIDRAGGSAGLQERVRAHGEVLCTLASALSDAELDTPVPTLLLSNREVLVDQPVPLRDLVGGLADAELPGHAKQLMALLPAASGAATIER